MRQEIWLFRNPRLAVDDSKRAYMPVKKVLTLNNQSPGFLFDLDGNLLISESNSEERRGEEERELSPRIESQSLKGPYHFRDRELRLRGGKDLAKAASHSPDPNQASCLASFLPSAPF